MGLPPPPDSSWYWKKIVHIKDTFKRGRDPQGGWHKGSYTVSQGYMWLLGITEIKSWSKALWSRSIIPRRTFTSWAFYHQRLPVKSRLAKFMPQPEGLQCIARNEAEEDIDHVFFSMWMG